MEDGLPAPSRMRELCREVIAGLQQVFGEHVNGYVIDRLVDDSHPSVEFHFELYAYYPMTFGYDRGSFGFAIDYERSIGIPLSMGEDSDLEPVGATVQLAELLREAILLRIPDKYLESIGVQNDRTSRS